jgi:hypothetical protein
MQGLPTSYSAPITITASAGTAVFTGTDGTRSLTLTPNTTNVINSIGGGVNLSIGGTAALQIGTSRNVTVAAPASGVALTVNAIAGTHSTKIADSAGSTWDAGYLGLPANAQTANYTAVLADRGKHIPITTGGVNLPVSVFSAGDSFVVYNNSASAQTIFANTSVTTRLAGTTTTGTGNPAGNRTLAAWGLATVLCVTGGATPTFVVGGPGVS